MIIAIDSGGTKTKILAADEKGKVFFETVIKGFGLPFDNENGPLSELIECIKTIPSYEKTGKIVANLGGKNSGQLKNTLESVCPDADIEVFRESSGIIGDFIREKIGADVIIFAGTGAITLGKGENGYFVSDGWGRDIGDMGSGYFIGLESVRTCLKALEEDKITPFVTEITGETEPFPCVSIPDGLVEKRDTVRKNILPLDRDKTAAFTKVAAKHAKSGDALAIAVFEKAGSALADTAERVCRKIGKTNNVTIAVSGGIANIKELWEQAFKENFSKYAENFKLVFPETDFAKGALMYALENR